MQKHIDQQNRVNSSQTSSYPYDQYNFKNETLIVIFSYVYVSVLVYAECSAHGGQNRASFSLDLEVQVFVSHLM